MLKMVKKVSLSFEYMLNLGLTCTRLFLFGFLSSCILIFSVLPEDVLSAKDKSDDTHKYETQNNEALGLKITLIPESKVRSTTIYFKDVARCSGSNVCDDLYGVKIKQLSLKDLQGRSQRSYQVFQSSSNQAGEVTYSVEVTSHDVLKALSKEYQYNFQFFGKSTKVELALHKLDQKDIQDRVKSYISNLVNKSGSYKVDVKLGFISNINVTDDPYRISFNYNQFGFSEEQLLKTFLTRSRYTLEYTNNFDVLSFDVNLRVKLEKKVLVSSRQIPKDSIIQRSDVEFRYLPVNYYTAKAFSTFNQLLGKKTRSTIFVNKPITSSQLVVEHDVEKDQVLTLKTKSKSTSGLSMTRLVKATRSGDQGQVIGVIPVGEKNNTKANRIEARIINKTTVETL